MSKKEKVKHPSHYNKGIEMWDYAHSHNLDFLRGTLLNILPDGKIKMG